MEDALKDVTATRVTVHEEKFAGVKGFLFNYSLSITNNIDRPKKYSIPVFIDNNNRHNNRISQYFTDASNLKTSELIAGELNLSIDEAIVNAHLIRDQKAESIFLEHKNDQEELLKEIEEKMKKYFRDKEESIKRIAVDNIRSSRLLDLDQESPYRGNFTFNMLT
jgi:hypothetical protein